MTTSNVLLVSMPFGALDRQALGVSLLKARLLEQGVSCDVRYLTFSFAEFIGYEAYQWLSFEAPYTAFAGDWSFTWALYGSDPVLEQEYIEKVLRGTWRLADADITRILHIRSYVEPFLDFSLASIAWQDYAVVGFTSTFEQNIASLALAKRVKAAYPDVVIVFGGANWEADMGQELHRQFGFVDFVCSGEADDSFPMLVHHLMTRVPAETWTATVPGLVYRDKTGASANTGPPQLITNLDRIPTPDFTEYFRDLELSTLNASVLPTLLIETSRGCWWGAKSHCTFCGLNGGSLTFRSKSSQRALDELEQLVSTWRVEQVEVVDNILDMKYFGDFLPMLVDRHLPAHLFYEVKANLTRDQLVLLRKAGVQRIQPGIESMSDHVLKLMRKGTTALRNVQLLKWCQELGIIAEWNLLYGFPGETLEDYQMMLRFFPAIRFLRPPSACGPIRLDRFSPYFESPAEFGFSNIRPLAPYQYLYPFNSAILANIAYYFEFDYAPDVDPVGYASDVIEYVREWQQHPELGGLYSSHDADGQLMLIDTRADALRRSLTLNGPEQVTYEYCDSVRALPGVVRFLRSTFDDLRIDECATKSYLESMVANRLMVTDGTYYLSLALRLPGIEARIRPVIASTMTA